MPEIELQDLTALATPLRLVLPALGWLEVVVRPDSETGHPDSVLWRRAVQGSNGGFETSHRGSVEFKPGISTARIGPVGLGWLIHVEVLQRGRAGQVAGGILAGPVEPGEVVRHEFTSSPAVELRGVAMDADGVPFRSVRLTFLIGDSTQSDRRYTSFVTDANGQWAIRIEPGFKGTELRIETADRMPPRPQAIVDVTSLLSGAPSKNLGEVVLRLPAGSNELLAEGRVCSTDGLPVEDAHVTVKWNGERLGRSQTDSVGHFEIYGGAGPHVECVEVFASAKGYLPSDVLEPRVGANHVDFRLTQGARLSGELLLDTWLPRDFVGVALEGSDVDRQLTLMDFGPQFSFDGLRQETFTLRFRVLDASWTVLKRSASVALGQETELGTIDLRGRFRRVELRLVGPRGAPIEAETFELRDAIGAGFPSIATDRHGRITCLVPADLGYIFLIHPSYEDASVELTTGTIDVTLVERDG